MNKRVLSFSQFISLNEGQLEDLQVKKQQLVQQQQNINKQLLDLEQQILNVQKQNLNAAKPGVTPNEALVNEDFSKPGMSPTSSLEVLDVEDTEDSLDVFYKSKKSEEEQFVSLSKLKFFEWYEDWAERNYGKEYVNSYKEVDYNDTTDEDGRPVKGEYVDNDSMWTAEKYEDMKSIVAIYLLFLFKNPAKQRSAILGG